MERYDSSMRSTNVPRGIFATIGWTLCAVGALNWGLVGLFKFNLVHFLFGRNSALERGVYLIVGLSGLMSFLRLAGFIRVARPRLREATSKLRRAA